MTYGKYVNGCVRYVSGYLRTYPSRDGVVTEVTDEPAEFREDQLTFSPRFYGAFVPGKGLPVKLAEELVQNWNMLGQADGYTYRLPDDPNNEPLADWRSL